VGAGRCDGLGPRGLGDRAATPGRPAYLWQLWVVVPEPVCGDELADDDGAGVGELVLCADAIGTSQTAKATTMIAATKAADSLFIMWSSLVS
jgi:hypothetical protein